MAEPIKDPLVQFDPSLNMDYHALYDDRSDLIADITGGAVASVTDFGATIWNSITPDDYEVQTRDILSGFSDNALRVYDEHRDAVELASFVGGVVAPAGITLKALKAMRAGDKGFSWFSQAGKESHLAKMEQLFTDGTKASAEYRKARNTLFARTAGNEMLDSFAIEGMIVLTQNEHPFMEDYMKDPVSNFLLWGGIGGVLGGGIGLIADNHLIKSAAGKIETDAFYKTVADLDVYQEGVPSLTKLKVHQANIDTLEALLGGASKAGPVELNELTRDIARATLLEEQARQAKLFDAFAKDLLPGIPKEEATALMERLTKNLALGDVDAVHFLKQQDEEVVKQLGGFAKLKPLVAPVEFVQAMNKKLQKPYLKTQVLFPDGTVGQEAHAFWYAPAASIDGIKPSTLGQLGPNYLRVPHVDQGLLLTSKSSASVDKAYLDHLKYIDGIDLTKYKQIVVDPGDIPTIQALIAKAQKEPDLFSKVQLKLTSQLPDYSHYEARTFSKGGVAPDHLAKIEELLYFKHNIRGSGISQEASEFIDDWSRGGPSIKARFRQAFDSYFRKSTRSSEAHLAKEIYESTAAQDFRKELRKLADSDGNIYLYRGLSGKAIGHGAVESYTVAPSVAEGFGISKLYKVAVDDVIGHVASPGFSREREILVGSPAREAREALPLATKGEGAVPTIQKTENISLVPLSQHLVKAKEEVIRSLAQAGLSPAAIGLRVNVPKNTVEAFLASGGRALDELELPWMEYTSADRIPEYLSSLKRPIVLKANINKVPYADFLGKLQTNTSLNINQQLIESFLIQSKSQIARDIQKDFFEEYKEFIGIMRMEVSNAVNQKAGWRFFNSTDFYSRDMKNFGIMANHFGKKIQHIANEAEKRLIKPFTESMSEIAKDEAAIIEANLAFQLNASLKGPRYYKDRKFWQTEKVVNDAGKEVDDLVPSTYQGREFEITSDYVDALLTQLDQSGRELYHLKNTINKILGKPDLSDLGFWVPAFDPRDKFINYVWNKLTDQTQLLWGNTEDELLKATKAFSDANSDKILKGTIQVVSKKEQELYNTLNGRADPLTMSIANLEKLHGGSSATAVVRANLDVFGEIAGGYQHYINSHVRQLSELTLHDITDILDRMSAFNQGATKNQPLSSIKAALFKPKDAAKEMKNILLGSDAVSNIPAWKSMNQSFETGLGFAIQGFNTIWKTVAKPLGPKGAVKIDYEKMDALLQERGIINPYQIFDDAASDIFEVAKLTESKNSSKRLIYASNGLAAMAALRFGELAQPLVNAMSLPILSTSAIAGKLPESFLGVQKGTAKINPVAAMYEGMRAANSKLPQWKELDAIWAKQGYYEPFVSEASSVLSQARRFEPGGLAKAEAALESNLVKWASWTADKSESLVRRQSLFTGAVIAKRLYPELNNAGVTIFARHFMDQAIGNYHAAQRPTMFQGSLGVAMGLFQTYMLTMAQSIYRHLELKDYKALGKMMLTQTTIFGTGSLPGFSPISKMIGEHFSDEHTDLTTGTFKALGDPMASLVLYGLPSSIGPAFYSRGELQPRVPMKPGDMPSVNMAGQVISSFMQIKDALSRDYPDMGRAFGEALSMQSISRPLARGAELVTGYSVTRQGNTIAVPEEVWATQSVIARIIGTRPLEEAKLRDAIYLDRFYKSMDHDARQEVTEELKTAIRSNSLSDEKLSNLAEEYMRTGTSQGWRSALNTAIAQTEVSGREALLKKLRPDSPLNFMIDSLDGE